MLPTAILDRFVNTATIIRSNLTLISGNSITQTGAGNLTISGTADFVASGNVNLANRSNDFGSVTSAFLKLYSG
jgi:hypothetical protein